MELSISFRNFAALIFKIVFHMSHEERKSDVNHPKRLVWRKLNVKVPPSKVIIGGVDSIHVDSEL